MTHKDFLQDWVELIKEKKLKTFPDDFINGESTKDVELPSKTLILGPELFGAHELLDVSGNIVYNAATISEAKYVLYANRLKPAVVKILLDEEKIEIAVKEYEAHLDSLLKEAEKDFLKKFPDSNKFYEISNNLFQTLFIQRY